MKITIDEKVCLKHKMTLNEVLIALAIRTEKLEDNLENMVKREILVEDNSYYQVTQHWSDVIDEILCDSSDKVGRTDEQLLDLAKKMREVYPQGRQPNSPYLYRCNPKEIMLKLKKFFITYGQYSDEDILDATKRYVASFRGNYQYLKLLKYFISKNEDEEDENGLRHKVEHSYLADYLENKEEQEGVEVTNSDDWLMNSRN